MKKFQYDFAIDAQTQTDADAKMTALVTLAIHLSVKEIAKLAHIIKNDPIKTAMAKKYLGV
jgi:hypothetical protein